MKKGIVSFCILILLVLNQSFASEAPKKEIDWSKASGSEASDINPELKTRLENLGQRTKTDIKPNSANRTEQEQRDIGNKAIKDKQGYYRDQDGTVRDSEGNAKVAAPGSEYSRHEKGNAVDLNRNGKDEKYYTEEELNRSGLTRDPAKTNVKKEPWHIIVDPNLDRNGNKK